MMFIKVPDQCCCLSRLTASVKRHNLSLATATGIQRVTGCQLSLHSIAALTAVVNIGSKAKYIPRDRLVLGQSHIVASSLRLGPPLTLRKSVAEQLRIAIVTGHLEPGAPLTEGGLALQLGVSATPVREALVDLASEGLVEIETHRLKRVAPIHLPAILDLLRVQGLLWQKGYLWGIPHVGPAELVKLETAVTAYQAALSVKDILAAVRAGNDFHTVFIAASGSSELLRVTLDRRALIARFILLRAPRTISATGLKHHRSMLDDFRRGDTESLMSGLDRISSKLIALAQDAAVARKQVRRA